jgi:secreted trypsin-like serine protease
MGRRSRLIVPACGLAALALLVPAAASAAVQPRVVGGHTASVSDYPWQVAVVDNPSVAGGNAHARQFCGGSLITSRIVITAAHCVREGTTVDPSDVDVVVGRTTLSVGSQGAEIPVEDVAYRSNYNAGTSANDVGYLVLSAPSAQTPIKIAGADETALWEPDRLVDVSGWGSTSETGSTVDTLRAATVEMISDSVCGGSSVYGSEFKPASMVCAGFMEGGTDTCYGDSGGPLESPLAGGGYRLVGLTSWGNGCAEPSAPGVYTRVAGSTLAPLVASDVADLESANGLSHAEIFGSGGEPAAPLQTPPPGTTASPKPGAISAAIHPFAKCKRARTKLKRRRCTKKVRAGLAHSLG